MGNGVTDMTGAKTSEMRLSMDMLKHIGQKTEE